MIKGEQVYDSLMYELAAIGRDEPGHVITGETREEKRESLRVIFDRLTKINNDEHDKQ